MTELKRCPFCGGRADPEGWLRNDGVRGPECEGCGATASDVKTWNTRPASSGVSDEKIIAMNPYDSESRNEVDRTLYVVFNHGARAVRDLCASQDTGGRERDAVEFAVRMMIEVDMSDEEIRELADQLYADYLKGR